MQNIKLFVCISAILLLVIFPAELEAQPDSLQNQKIALSAGITLGPQMLFIGGLDVGIFCNLEANPFNKRLAFLAGADLRNKWFHIPLGNEGLDTHSLKSTYNIIGMSYLGAGVSFYSKSGEKNSLYLTGTPYMFAYKESVNADYLTNTVQRTVLGFNAGITWSSTKINKNGRQITTQFYVPVFSRHFLDDMRYMNLKIGIPLLN
jgi:hypothetical protein